jgi:hypothetical protein
MARCQRVHRTQIEYRALSIGLLNTYELYILLSEFGRKLRWGKGDTMSTIAVATPAYPETRVIAISVIDKALQPLEGASVSFFENNALLGNVITGIRGASITLSHLVQNIHVQAIYAGTKQETGISTLQISHTFVFARIVSFKSPYPIAQCPNGDTGQPCVDCVINGRKIRICA